MERKRGITPLQARKLRAEKGLEETRLQRMRVKKGLSQVELSVRSGVPARAIRAYEQKERQIDLAKLQTLCDLSAALGCKIDDILENKELIKKFKTVV